MAYDGLICISTAIEDYGKIYNKSTIRIPILTDPFKKIAPTKNIYHKENSFNIGFSGSIQPLKENLINFLHVLAKLKESQIDFTFNLCGFIKLSDYLDHGKPILITNVSDNHLFIKDDENGFIVEPDNNDIMYNKLIYIIDNIKLFEKKMKISTIETSLRHFYFKNYKVILSNFLFN